MASKALNKRCKAYLAQFTEKEANNYGNPANELACCGYLSCLKYVLAYGAQMTAHGLVGAIEHGPHRDVIQYAIEELRLPWSAAAIQMMVRKDDADLLRYVKRTRGAKYIDSYACLTAAMSGSLNCLQLLHKNAKKWQVSWNDPLIFTYAAGGGHLHCVKYLHESGCEWSDFTCDGAASSGNLALLQYCHENDAPWSEGTVTNCAKVGHLDCLKYAVENGAPLRAKAVSAAMGHLECLKYLHQHLGQLTRVTMY